MAVILSGSLNQDSDIDYSNLSTGALVNTGEWGDLGTGGASSTQTASAAGIFGTSGLSSDSGYYYTGWRMYSGTRDINNNLQSLIYKKKVEVGETFEFTAWMIKGPPSGDSVSATTLPYYNNDNHYFTWKYIDHDDGGVSSFLAGPSESGGQEITSAMVTNGWRYGSDGESYPNSAQISNFPMRLGCTKFESISANTWGRKYKISIINNTSKAIYLKMVTNTSSAGAVTCGSVCMPKRVGKSLKENQVSGGRFKSVGIGVDERNKVHLPLDVYNSGGLICGYSHYDVTSQSTGVTHLTLTTTYQRIPGIELNVIMPASNIVEISLRLGLRDDSATQHYTSFKISDNVNPTASASWGAALSVSNFADVAIYGGYEEHLSQIGVKWIIHGDRISKKPGDNIRLYFHANKSEASATGKIYVNGSWGPIIIKAISLPANGIYGTSL